MTGSEIDLVENPRKEASHNDLLVANDNLLQLGLDPITLQEELLTEVTEIAQRYMDRCDRSRIPCTSLWVPRADEEFAEPSAI
jgi:UDP-sulfoquinovose synthase